MQSTGKKLLACSLAAAVMSITGTALAGQEPYVATVGPDTGASDGLFSNPNKPPKRDLDFYLSPKVNQFTEHEACPDVFPNENFVATSLVNTGGGLRPITQPEICDTAGQTFGDLVFRGDWQARSPGGNQGSYRWRVALPKKPNGPINVVLECGILKPQQFQLGGGFHAVKTCAGYTGESASGCASTQVPTGSINPGRLPWITVRAHSVNLLTQVGTSPNYPPITGFGSAWLKAFPNPGSYNEAVTLDPVANNAAAGHRKIAMKACMDKTVILKLPAEEPDGFDLQPGDIIEVTLNIPSGNQLDIYCGRDSLKIQGIGEPCL